MTCDLCHGEPAKRTYKGRRLCTDCANGMEDYDAMTPEERRADEESIARYVDETQGLA